MIWSPQVVALAARLMALYAPPANITVSEWADQHRQVSTEVSADPGQWVTRSYQREPQDCCSDPAVRRVVIKAGTQLVKSSTIENAVGRVLDVDPMPVLILAPRKDDAEYFSLERFDPMVRDTPRLASRQIKRRKFKKIFRGAIVNILWGSVPANAASRAIGVLAVDEIDKLRITVEGSIIAQARQRLATYKQRAKEILASSPTYEGSEIDRAYAQSDQRQFFLKCPHCQAEQSLMKAFFTNVRWDESLASREEQALSARYHCQACDQAWDESERRGAVEGGRWIAQKPFAGVAGFWISELYSLSKRLSQVVLDYLEKKDDPSEYRVFVNTALAENFAGQGDAPDWAQLVKRAEEYSMERVPKGVLVMTVGADVHPNRIEATWWGWGRNREKWALKHEVILGRTSDMADMPGSPWRTFEALLAEVYTHELGGDIGVSMTFVDSGNQTNDVYQWARTQPSNRQAIKGSEKGLPVSQPSAVDVTIGGRKIQRGLRIRTVCGPFFKDEGYADFRRELPTDEQLRAGFTVPTGFTHFPKGEGWGDEQFKQLTGEQLVTSKDKRGRVRREWQRMRSRNEVLDCYVYARAAAWELGLDRMKEREWKQLEHRLTADLFVDQARQDIPQAQTTRVAEQQPEERAPSGPATRDRDRDRGGWLERRKGWLQG